MRTMTVNRWSALALGGLLCMGSPSWGQVTMVSSEDADVIMEGDYVRVETSQGAIRIDGDWRRGASAGTSDLATVLIELGAVEADGLLRVSLAGDVLFDLGSAVVTEAAEGVLRKSAQVIRDRAVGEVLVVGHTDSLGARESNQRLSEARAVAVLRWLEDQEGIPATVLVGRGRGEEQPVAKERTADGRDDPAGRARNRRVELFVATRADVDVRDAADRVTISSAAGDVVVEDDQVDIGGLVRVHQGSVQVGSVAVGAGGAVTASATSTPGSSGSRTCPAGRLCEADCPEGNCRMVCSAGARCDYGCQGGDCSMSCAAGATCDFHCAGGDCRFSCATGSSCATSCAGGDCAGG